VKNGCTRCRSCASRLRDHPVDEAHLERAVNAYLTLQKTMARALAPPVCGDVGQAGKIGRPQGGADPVRRYIDPRILASIMVRELERDYRIVPSG
jgi:threonine dehydratase